MTKYQVHDSHGAPQCGCEVTTFESLWEAVDFVFEDEGRTERLNEGYIVIKSIICGD